MSIYTNLHDKYGSASLVAEFRLFVLNRCQKACDSCFYRRSGNQISTHSEALKLAYELHERGYRLETCYLLPTDFFDNPANVQTIKALEVKAILERFEFVGIATTLEGEINFKPISEFITGIDKKLEVQINIVNERLYDENYIAELETNKRSLEQALGERVVFNIAVNLGGKTSKDEITRIQSLVKRLSDDGVVEINFTFLYNKLVKKDVMTEMLLRGFKDMNTLAQIYNKS